MRVKRNPHNDPVIEGSGNVFADLGLPDAEELHLKAELTRQLSRRIQSLGLSQIQAAKRLGLKQPDVSKLVNGRHTGFSADRLLALLNALEVNVEIILRPQSNASRQAGTIRVSEAAAV